VKATATDAAAAGWASCGRTATAHLGNKNGV
jgi:hypothetical protein